VKYFVKFAKKTIWEMQKISNLGTAVFLKTRNFFLTFELRAKHKVEHKTVLT